MVRLLSAEVYQPQALGVVDVEIEAIGLQLPGVCVEHIGSSAIPGAVSKGDIDLCVLVPQVQFEQALASLEKRGFRQKPDTLRTDELCMLIAPRSDIDLAVQLIVRGSKFEFFLHFRDALRDSPELVEAYNRVKLDAAHLSDEGYRAAKSRFIEAVLTGADWA